MPVVFDEIAAEIAPERAPEAAPAPEPRAGEADAVEFEQRLRAALRTIEARRVRLHAD